MFVNNKFKMSVEPVSCIDEIKEKTCLSTGKLEYLIETFRALSVGRD